MYLNVPILYIYYTNSYKLFKFFFTLEFSSLQYTCPRRSLCNDVCIRRWAASKSPGEAASLHML